MKKNFYLFILSILSTCGLYAQYVAPSEGVFRIVNVEYGVALTEDENSNLYSNHANGDSDYTQLWFLRQSGSNYTIQNLASKKFIQTGNIAHEVAYWTGLFPCGFNIVANPSKGANAYNIWDPTYKDPSLGTIGLHSKGQNDKVVRWNSESHKAASEWRFVSVEVPEDYLKELEEYQKELEKDYEILQSADKYETALADLFEDQACTKLKAAYASMGESELQGKLEALNLPEALVAMVLKVRSGDWAEPNDNPEKPGWDSEYAKKFRVQLVEPYSVAGEITNWFQINGHSNMDNPTGLYANDRDFMFIFVEGEIKEGSELWVTWLNGHTKMPNYNNGYSNGKRLESGLNIIPFAANGCALYFNYLVHTYDGSTQTFPHKLSDFDDLKIHVEGGHINSYYNAYGDALYKADTDADWVYYEERANLRNITILGKRQVLQFELNDVTITEEKDGNTNTWTEKGLAKLFPDMLPKELPENQRINAIVEAWDRIMFSELMTHGLVAKEEVDSINLLYPRWDAEWKTKAEIYNYDGYAEFCEGRDYSDYFNHHGLAFGTTSGYMYGSWDHCGYHINTTPSILTQIATEAGPGWGPAHEIGHQHQAIFTFNGLTEVTNNLFSNIGVWYMGMGTSRVNGTSGNLANTYYVYRTGGDFFGYETQHIWVQTQMYYRLWLYYHRVGHNTQFYPRLFELLRRNPLDKSGSWGSEIRGGEEVSFSNVKGRTTMLQFYQLCCDAAQEDLTEFFRAHGFFKVMDGRFVGDYSNSKYYQTQAEIDAAIAAVKAKGYPINKKALFVNDYTPDVTYRHDGVTPREYWDGDVTTKGENAEVGCYVDFLAKNPITGKYLYNITDLKVKIEGGDGALGFAIYNKEGEIQAFSSHHSFVINEEVESMIRNGEATVVAVTAEGDDVKILSKAEGGSEEEQLQVLKTSLAAANSLLKLVDDQGVNVGYYKPEALVALQALVDAAEAARDNKDTSVHSYGEWATLLDQMVLALSEDADAKVPLYEGDYYALSSIRHKNTSLEYSSAGLKVTFAAPDANAKKQWVFVAAETEGQYYIQNVSTGLFVSVVSENIRVKADATDTKDAVAFNLVEAESARFLLQSAENTALYLSCDGSKNIIAAKDNSTNAQWTLTSVADNHSEAMKAKLEMLLGMVANTLGELVEATEPELKFYADVTVLDEQLPAYVAALQEAYAAALKAIEEGYAYLESHYAALEAAHNQVKAAYRKTLSLPVASEGSKVMCYYLQCLDTEAYAYPFEGAGRYNGAIRTGELTDAADRNFWFYLRAGEAEGQYYIYNWQTGKAAGTSGRYLYVNGTADPVAYTISVAEDAYGYVIGTSEGVWNVQAAANGYAQFTSNPAMWLLVPIGEYETTGIAPVLPTATGNVYYDLQGRPVKNPTAGIYICNGCKVVVK